MTWTPTLRQLEYLVAVAETGGFGRAALRCAVSQPALSKQVQEVERGLGLLVFERGPRGASPTPAGRALIERARGILGGAQDLCDAAAAARDPLAGLVRLGLIPTLAPFLLPRLLAVTRRDLPRVDLHVMEAQSEVLGDALSRGELDVAVIALPYPRPGLRVRGLYEEPLRLVTPEGHPLSGDRPLLRAELEGHPLLLLPHGHCLRDHVLQACPSEARESTARPSSLATLLVMIRQGLGAAVLPEMALPPDRSGLCIRRFAPPEPTRGVGLWWRPSSPREALFERIGDLLIEERG